jgi:hypothetical protein
VITEETGKKVSVITAVLLLWGFTVCGVLFCDKSVQEMILPTLHNSNTFPAAFNCFAFKSRGIRGNTNGNM